MPNTNKVPYPTNLDVISFSWVAGFEFPDGFRQILTEKYSDWPTLMDALRRNDKERVWNLLDSYREKLGKFTRKDILDATSLEELQTRAKESKELKKFIKKLEQDFFPDDIEERKRQLERARLSWEY